MRNSHRVTVEDTSAWHLVRSLAPPDRRHLASSEWFYGRSAPCRSLAVFRTEDNFAFEVGIVGIDPAHPMARQVNAPEQYRLRNDREAFITEPCPVILDNR